MNNPQLIHWLFGWSHGRTETGPETGKIPGAQLLDSNGQSSSRKLKLKLDRGWTPGRGYPGPNRGDRIVPVTLRYVSYTEKYLTTGMVDPRGLQWLSHVIKSLRRVIAVNCAKKNSSLLFGRRRFRSQLGSVGIMVREYLLIFDSLPPFTAVQWFAVAAGPHRAIFMIA